jgi:hypothetical protein
MPFPKGNNKQLNFLHALQSDKAKGVTPPISQSLAAPAVKPLMPVVPPGPAPMIKPNPMPVTHMAQPAGPMAAKPPMMAPKPPINPMAAPGLPAMGNLPKFGKTRSSLRGSPFNKSNKA